MTKGGSFKRAVRGQARARGKTYTQMLATLQGDEVAARVNAATNWSGKDELPRHLERRYGIRVESLEQLSPHGAGVFRVDRSDGPSWVARVIPVGARAVDRLHGDVEILRFLEEHDFPAERCARPEPVSMHGGQHILVTEYVPGAPGEITAEHEHALANGLGHLHALPAASGAVSRDGGAFGHDPAREGKPRQDLAAAMSFLDAVVDQVSDEGRGRFESLRAQVADADGGDGLPEALTTPNVGDRDVIVTPEGSRVFVDWKPAGRGPRLPALGFLLHAALHRVHPGAAAEAAKPDLEFVDAIVSGYTKHIRLLPEELSRLGTVMRIYPLYFACWYYWRTVAGGRTPDGSEGWWPDHDLTDAVASEAVSRLAASVPPGASRAS